jgi:uncharacterized repeat protein (TIGR01451 family)
MNAFSFTQRASARILAAVALFSLVAGMLPMQVFAAVGDLTISGVTNLGDHEFTAGGIWSTVNNQDCHGAGPQGDYRYSIQVFRDIVGGTMGVYDAGDIIVQSINPAPCEGGQHLPVQGKLDADNETWPAATQSIAPFVLDEGSHKICAILRHQGEQGNDIVDTDCLPADVIVLPDVNLSLEKTADVTNPDEGDMVTYTITATNNGTDDATNVVISDDIPAGTTLVTPLSDGGTGTDPVTWNVGTILAGQSKSVHVTVTVDANTGGTEITNTATVTSTEDPTNDPAAETIDVVEPPIDYPSLKIEKQTNPDANTTPFSFTLDTFAAVPLTDGQSTTTGFAVAGSHTITEQLPAGWVLSDVACTADTGTVSPQETTNGVSLNIAMEQDVTCVFTNTKLGSITVNKEVTNDAPGDFDFTLDKVAMATLSDGEGATAANLAVGSYTLAEVVPQGWNMPQVSCSDGSVADDGEVVIDLAVGENVTCTYTNMPTPPPGEGFILVKKVATFLDAAVDTVFDFSASWEGAFALVNGAEKLFSINVDNNNGPFSVTEDVPAGWSSTPVCTSDAVQGELDNEGLMLVDGETVTCVFTNIELPECSNGLNDDSREDDLVDELDPGCTGPEDNNERDPVGSISIDKVVTGEGASDTQGFNFDYSWVDGDGADAVIAATSAVAVTSNLKPGEYTITEYDLPSRWNISSIQCTAGDEDTVIETNLQTKSVTIDLALGDNVDCVFTNEYTPRDSGGNTENIIVRKLVTGGSDTTQLFTFNPSWSETDFQLSHNTSYDSGDLNADEVYSVYEYIPTTWQQQNVSCVSDLDAERVVSAEKFTLQDGETITCTFTNDQILYQVYGYVWHDDNRNQDWDGRNDEVEGNEEDSLEGRTVRITNGSKTFETTTDVAGYYSFNVPAGTWTITEQLPSGWFQTAAESHTVTVPAESEGPSENLMSAVINFIVPTAHAAIAKMTYGEYNFGNDRRTGGGGGTRVDRDPEPEVLGDSDDRPEGEVLGEQVDAVPLGAADTGAGGTSRGLEFFHVVPVAFLRRKA